MMDAELLLTRCKALRAEETVADERDVADIERDVEAYRALLADPRPQLPPAELAELLPLMGWLVYEVTWQAIRRVDAAFETLDAAGRQRSEDALELVERAADAYRRLPWPEFAPRGLGAIRAQALAESKRDTEAGYDTAWILHEEARQRHESFGASLGDDIDNPLVLALDEVLLQLALAETGTACRTAERVIARWAEELDDESPVWTEQDSDHWTQKMFHQLHEGVEVGELALQVARRIRDKHGFVQAVDEKRMALKTALQNPGIMTARAALLMLAMCPEVEGAGLEPVFGESWEATRTHLLNVFTNAYRAIEEPVRGADDEPEAPKPAHLRSMTQLRLNLGLLVPGFDLPASSSFAPCLDLNPVDDRAVQAMSAWLAEEVGGTRRGDANVIGSATKASFIRSVVQCRERVAAGNGYHRWRRDWFKLDRYCGEPDRWALVDEVLHRTEPASGQRA
jgi:hypothetical protein